MPKKHHAYSAEDLSVIKSEIGQGLGHKALVAKDVSSRRFGKKPWSEQGLRKAIKRLKTGSDKKRARGRKRTARTAAMAQQVAARVEKHPFSAKGGSRRAIAKKFNLSAGPACRVLKEDLGAKCLRKGRATRWSEKHKEKRAAFCQEILDSVGGGS